MIPWLILLTLRKLIRPLMSALRTYARVATGVRTLERIEGGRCSCTDKLLSVIFHRRGQEIPPAFDCLTQGPNRRIPRNPTDERGPMESLNEDNLMYSKDAFQYTS